MCSIFWFLLCISVELIILMENFVVGSMVGTMEIRNEHSQISKQKPEWFIKRFIKR